MAGNITEYDPGIGAIRPSNVGAEAAATAGYRANRAFTELGASVDQTGRELGQDVGGGIRAAGTAIYTAAEHKEISHGSAAEAGLMDTLGKAWDDTVAHADPNDPTVAQKFREQTLEPALQKWQDQSFLTEGGQQWADRRADALRQHFINKAAVDMGDLAKAAVTKNLQTAANGFSNTAMRDPGSLPFLMRTMDDHVNAILASSPNLRGEALAQAKITLPYDMKKGLVKAAAIGAIMKSDNPEATANAFGEKYKDYINGDELKVLATTARTELRAARTDEMWREHQQEKQQKLIKDTAMDDWITRASDPATAGKINVRDMVHDPRLAGQPEAKENLINFFNRETKPETEAKISMATFGDFGRRILNGENVTMDDLMKARTKAPGEAGGLSRADFNELSQWVHDPRTPDGTKLTQERSEAVKGIMPLIDHSNPLVGTVDMSGHLQFSKFLYAVRQQEEYMRQQGKNIHDLYNPNSPDYIGNPNFYSKFLIPMDVSIGTIGSGLAPAEPNAAALAPTPENGIIVIGGKRYKYNPGNLPGGK